jgi:hypothetical protein
MKWFYQGQITRAEKAFLGGNLLNRDICVEGMRSGELMTDFHILFCFVLVVLGLNSGLQLVRPVLYSMSMPPITFYN